MQIETRYLFLLKFGLIQVLLSIDGVVGDPAKVSPRGYHEGHSSQSLFQLLFLLPQVDSIPCSGGIDRYKLSEAHHNLLIALRQCLAI